MPPTVHLHAAYSPPPQCLTQRTSVPCSPIIPALPACSIARVLQVLGAALCGLPDLTELDISTNPIDDTAVSTLCSTLLATEGAHSLICLNFGATGAGDGAAATCADAFLRPHSNVILRALCLSSEAVARVESRGDRRQEEVKRPVRE